MTKLALVSDTHGTLVWMKEVPPCDILVHSGDICPDHWKEIWCRKDLGRAAAWLSSEFIPGIQYLLDEGIIKQFICTLGNHDWVTRREAKSLSTNQIHFLVDAELTCMGLKFWGSPWSDQFFDWAWMAQPEELAGRYAAIPEDVDVLISHQPPISYGSKFYDIHERRLNRVGSKELEAELLRIKPKLVACGHIHGGHGRFETPEGVKVVNAAWLDERYRPAYPIEVVDL